MGKLKLIILVGFSFLLNCCSIFNNEPKYIKLADEVTFTALKKIECAKDLKLIGLGGSMMDNVKAVSLHFYCYYPASVGEARNLLVEITSSLINAFNSNEEIRPYLSNYPFTASNFEISITFTKEDNNYQDAPSVSLASGYGSNIYYYKYDKEKERLVDLYEESFADALEKADNT